MFSHVMIGTNDLEKAKSFYDAASKTRSMVQWPVPA